MPPREVHPPIPPPTPPTSADHAAIHSRLRLQIAKRDVHVLRPLLAHELIGFLLRRHLVRTFAAALAEAAEIYSQDVEPRSGEAFGEIVPNFALAIALMQ